MSPGRPQGKGLRQEEAESPEAQKKYKVEADRASSDVSNIDNIGRASITAQSANASSLTDLDPDRINKKQLLQGCGKVTFPDGDIYEGQFKDGEIHGQGKLTRVCGEVQEGQFEKGVLHGMGKVILSNGDVYEGQFENGEACGQGKMTYANGDVYEGQFEKGVLRGHGKWDFR
jgi:hypothetical protein